MQPLLGEDLRLTVKFDNSKALPDDWAEATVMVGVSLLASYLLEQLQQAEVVYSLSFSIRTLRLKGLELMSAEQQ